MLRNFSTRRGASLAARYTFAVGVVALASVARSALTLALGEGVPFILYFPTVVLCAWFGGLGPGLLSAALGGLVAWYVFIPPYYSFTVSDPTAPHQLTLFLLASALISVLAESLHRSRRRALENETREREQRERLRVTLASVGDAVIATDAEGRVTLMNTVAESLTGWGHEDAAGRPLDEVFNIVNEQTRERVGNPALRAIRTGAITGLANHTVLIRKDGTEIPIDDSGAPIKDTDGRVLGAILIFRDITERRRADDTFRLAVESAPNAMVMVDRHGHIVLVNSQTERLFGYTRGELIGQAVEVLVPQRFRHAHTEDRTKFHRAPEMRAMGAGRELHGVRKDGREVPIEIGLNPLEIAGQTFVLSAIVDITERQRAEEALRGAYEEARKRQRAAESLAAVARTINTLDLAGVLQAIAESASTLLEADVATVFRLDANGEQMTLIATGGPRGSTLTRDVSVPRGTGLIWLAADQREAVVSADLLIDERFVYTPEMRARVEEARHRAGLAVPLIVLGRIIGVLFVGALPGRAFSADEIRLVTTFADQAAVAMANAELYDEAQRANRTKDEFLAMLGHELRNPLGAIAGASGVLKLTAAQGPGAERARVVIDRQVQHLSHLVDDLLDIGRLTTGKVRLTRKPLELGRLVAGAMSAWRAAGRFARHQVTEHVSSMWIHADETRMEQILENLVGNALKYTPAGGGVTVRLTRAGESAVLEVADMGAGIPPNLGDKIFDLFVQGERPLDRAQGGLGIGLTLVKTLVGLHGGTVEARSDGPDRGSVFTIRLPSVPAPAEAPAMVGRSAPAAAARRILLIEDNEDAREMFRLQLVLQGHEVHEAADGQAGVEVAASVTPDIAFVDLGLPGLDGYEVARRIRAGKRGNSIVLIALTGYGQAEDRARALDAGFDGHLTKPISPERLAAVIAEAATPR